MVDQERPDTSHASEVLELNSGGGRLLLVKIDPEPLQISRAEAKDPYSLTPAEREVANAALAGLSDQEIAAKRNSSPRTVAAHLRSVFKKIGVSSRTELAARIFGEKRSP